MIVVAILNDGSNNPSDCGGGVEWLVEYYPSKPSRYQSKEERRTHCCRRIEGEFSAGTHQTATE